jgi:catechol 2,3-dioxygenase-like lactoylglutathione lyase family enzyme
MKIGFVTVFVTNFDKALDFYTKTLGMEIDYTDQANWAQFKSGEDVSLAIEKCAPDYVEQGSKMVGRFVGVTLMVDDIERAIQSSGGRGRRIHRAARETTLGRNPCAPEGPGGQRADPHAGSGVTAWPALTQQNTSGEARA